MRIGIGILVAFLACGANAADKKNGKKYEFGLNEDYFPGGSPFKELFDLPLCGSRPLNQELLSQCDEMIDTNRFAEAWELMHKEENLRQRRSSYLLNKILKADSVEWQLAMDVTLAMPMGFFLEIKHMILVAIGDLLIAKNVLPDYQDNLRFYMRHSEENHGHHNAICKDLRDQNIFSAECVLRLRMILARSI